MRLSITPTGRALLILGIVAYAAGWLLGYVPLVMLTAGCVAALLLSLLYVAQALHIDVARRIEPTQVTVGEPAVAIVEITNTSRRRRPRITIEESVGSRTVIQEVSPGRDGPIIYDLPTDRRGIFQVGPTRMRRDDPLGLWQRSQTLATTEMLHVYPHWFAVEPVPSGLRRDLDGLNDENTPDGTIAFHSLREYQIGDDLRSIHWKSTARVGTLMVRQNADTSQPRTTVWLDSRAAMHTEESFERAVEVAASISVAAAKRVYPVEVRSTDGAHAGSLSTTLPARVFLEHLAGVSLQDVGSLAADTESMRAGRAESLVIITTAAATREDQIAIAHLAQDIDSLTVVNMRPDLGRFPLRDRRAFVIDAATADGFAHAWNVNSRG